MNILDNKAIVLVSLSTLFALKEGLKDAESIAKNAYKQLSVDELDVAHVQHAKALIVDLEQEIGSMQWLVNEL